MKIGHFQPLMQVQINLLNIDMTTDRNEIIKSGAEAGKSLSEVRRELISGGYATEDLEVQYEKFRPEGGEINPVSEAESSNLPKGVAPEQAQAYSAYQESRKSRQVKNLIKLSSGLIVIVAVLVLVIAYSDRLFSLLISIPGVEPSNGELTASDVARESQLLTYQAAAETYRSRLTDYVGLCDSIGIDDSRFSCNAKPATYAIETRLSTGEYYCVDSRGFRNVVPTSLGKGTQCQ